MTAENTMTPWYSQEGPDDDVVISTKARLARNLADFPFCKKFNGDDGERVKSLVRDALPSEPEFSVIDGNEFTEEGRNIFTERGILRGGSFGAAAVSGDESLSCLVNSTDHLRISAYSAGAECAETARKCLGADSEMQKKLQFAASREFGYLNAELKNCGSGLKISVRCHIPACVMSGTFAKTDEYLDSAGLESKAVFAEIPGSDCPTAIYDIANRHSSGITELDVMAAVKSAAEFIVKTERKIRARYADNQPAEILNLSMRAWAKAMFSRFLKRDESVNVVSAVKFGLHAGSLEGISDAVLDALIFRTQKWNLDYIIRSHSLPFEQELEDTPERRIDRLRAVVFQEAFEKIRFTR